jgi:hypothetical protein
MYTYTLPFILLMHRHICTDDLLFSLCDHTCNVGQKKLNGIPVTYKQHQCTWLHQFYCRNNLAQFNGNIDSPWNSAAELRGYHYLALL